MTDPVTTAYRYEVCFVILTHNRPERCLACIRQAARALRGSSGKILVINNSTQPVITRPIIIPEAIESARCIVVNVGRNMGVAARNIALQEAESEFLIMLDDDVLLELHGPERGASGDQAENNGQKLVKEIIRIFRSDPQIGAVALTPYHNGHIESCLLPTVFHGCACGFRTSALEKIGGYPSRFLYYGEEYSIAFRLYQAGYRIVMSGQLQGVYHAREKQKRNLNRILRLLVRNNTWLWVSSFPWHAVPLAVSDVIKRYFLVARKEKALGGFLAGCGALPWTILRGLCQRTPLNRGVFRKIALIEPLETICGQIQGRFRKFTVQGFPPGAGPPAAEKPEVIICGTGKFPSLWLKVFVKHGISVRAFWDTNSCWKGQKIRGMPVMVAPDQQTDCGQTPVFFVVGASSFSETSYWKEYLSGLGLHPLRSSDLIALPGKGRKTGRPEEETFADSGIFDLLQDVPLELYYTPGKRQ